MRSEQTETQPNPVTEALAEKIRVDRQHKGYTESGLGFLVNKSKSWVSKIESGDLTPTHETISDLGAILRWNAAERYDAHRLVNLINGKGLSPEFQRVLDGWREFLSLRKVEILGDLAAEYPKPAQFLIQLFLETWLEEERKVLVQAD